MPVNRLFWDIETSPNIVFSWRTGPKMFVNYEGIIQERAIICLCYKWEGKKKIHSLTWDDGDDGQMLHEFAKVADQSDEMVAHNGDRFDLRWFNARNMVHNLDPLPQFKTVDTLKMSHRRFNLNSHSLDYLATLLLGEGKSKTSFDMWRKIVLDNDSAAMNKMVKYCKRDVKILERVWNKLRDYDAPATHAAVNESGDVRDRWMCPHCGSDHIKKSKTRVTAKGMKQHQMVCLDCNRYYSIANKVFTWYLENK